MFRWLIFLILMSADLNAENNFGKTKLFIRKFEKCKGPKRLDCCVTTLEVSNPTTIIQKFDVKENIALTHGKVVGTSNGKEILKFPIKNPCRNIILKTILRTALNITNDCVVLKGSFELLIEKFEQCQGPKRKECAITTAKITNKCQLEFSIDVKENVKTTKGKIVVSVKGKETMRLQMKDPCKHLFMKPLLQALLNTTSDCVIKKGVHSFNVDVQEVAKKYYGGEFLYGKWTFKAVFYNDECTFSCSVIEVSMVPKNSDKLNSDKTS